MLVWFWGTSLRNDTIELLLESSKTGDVGSINLQPVSHGVQTHIGEERQTVGACAKTLSQSLQPAALQSGFVERNLIWTNPL